MLDSNYVSLVLFIFHHGMVLYEKNVVYKKNAIDLGEIWLKVMYLIMYPDIILKRKFEPMDWGHWNNVSVPLFSKFFI